MAPRAKSTIIYHQYSTKWPVPVRIYANFKHIKSRATWVPASVHMSMSGNFENNLSFFDPGEISLRRSNGTALTI